MSQVKLPSIFSDGMVIGKSAKIWGEARANQGVTAEFCGKKYDAVSDKTGRFEFTIQSEEFGGPFELKVEDTIISDVHVGRVWLCGGQSNMEGPLSRTRLSLGEFIKDDPRIRVFQAEKGLNFERPQKDVNGTWNSATGDFLNHMFAVPYFFARNLLSEGASPEIALDDVKIGLVCIAAGGTSIEGFLPEKIVREHPEIYEKLLTMKRMDYVKNATMESENAVNSWYDELSENDKGFAEDWKNPNLDDSDWQSRVLLDPTGSPRFGSVWLRRKFNLDSTDGEFILDFGRLENSVTIYINGNEVTNIGYMYPPCCCAVPNELLMVGENTLTVRIVGDTHTPRVVPGKDYMLLTPGGRVDFTIGKWKWRVGAKAKKCPESAFFYSNPCGVYNYMLAPLLGYSAEGMIWYQGESNTGTPHSYKTLFTAFVQHIRRYFGEIPVIFTQIANYIDPHSYPHVGGFGAPGGYWAILREQQRQCLQIPNTAMAVAIDCGEYNDLHPADKKSVGDRLALHARRLVYGEDIVADGPTVERVEYNPVDTKITVHFNSAEGLWAKGGHPTMLVVFKDGSCHSIFCAIRGNTMESPVGSPTGTLIPRAVRFCWADCPAVPVYNAYGLPASPFEEVIKDKVSAGGYGT